jgi:type IV secretory pathway TrbL component
MLLCVGPPDVIVQGSPTVMIGGPMAARMGDMTAHGGTIVMGIPTVMIGESAQGAALSLGAKIGAALADKCA